MKPMHRINRHAEESPSCLKYEEVSMKAGQVYFCRWFCRFLGKISLPADPQGEGFLDETMKWERRNPTPYPDLSIAAIKVEFSYFQKQRVWRSDRDISPLPFRDLYWQDTLGFLFMRRFLVPTVLTWLTNLVPGLRPNIGARRCDILWLIFLDILLLCLYI